MRDNVIVLAVGLSGSSVLTGVISRVGYWVGEATHKNPDYDTFENLELTRLNKQLLEAIGATEFGTVFRDEFIEKMSALYGRIDDAPFRAFVEKCNAHQPWLWKDPRLTVTIHYWKHLLDFSRVKVIVNDRDPMQAWIAWNMRRQIQSYGHAKGYNAQVVSSIREFLKERKLSHEHIRYEELIGQPEATLDRINAYLGSALKLEDLTKIYRGPLRKRMHGMTDIVKAGLIYLKNYQQRIG